MLIVNKAREAAACAQANCASSFTNATNAATSATNAANSATAAAASETNVENLWEQFNALYLGSFAVAPTTDNEGNPLQEGALYWNSVSNTMFAWNGSAWATATNFNEFTNFTATGTTTARNLVTRFADVANVKDFGAVGDGVADDTAAIQAAVNTGKSIYIPTGNYIVTGINLISNTTLFGDGPSKTIIKRNAANQINVISAIGTNSVNIQNILIRDIGIDGNTVSSGLPNYNGHGINFAYCKGVYLENIFIKNCEHNAANINGSSNVTIESCEFSKSYIGIYVTGYDTGVTVHTCNNIHIRTTKVFDNSNDGGGFGFGVFDSSIIGCQFYNNDTDSDGDGGAIVIASDKQDFPCRNIIVSNNIVFDSSIAFSGTQTFICTDNTIFNAGKSTTLSQIEWGHGIEVTTKGGPYPIGQAPSIEGIIDGNIIVNAAKHGIYITDFNNPLGPEPQYDIIVSDNYIKNCGNQANNTFDGINIQTTSRVVLNGNNIVNFIPNRTRYGIYSDVNSANVYCSSNLIYGMTTGDTSLNGVNNTNLYISSTSDLTIKAKSIVSSSTGNGTIKMGSANSSNSNAWLPITYNGTQYWIPAWTNPSP